MLEKLINTALLGTDKIDFDSQILPESIKSIADAAIDSDKAATFLRTAALVAFYEESGQKPVRFLGEIGQSLEIENQELITLETEQILAEIIEFGSVNKNELLQLYFDKIIEKKQILRPKAVVVLMGMYENLPKKLQYKANKIIGKKGIDLMLFKEIFKAENKLSDENIWHEGKLAERRLFFAELRQKDPKKAFELLQKTWKEESLVDKKGFLEEISKTLQPNDFSFLESLLIEHAFQQKEKKTQREIRIMLVKMLLKDTESSLSKNTFLALEKYFSKAKSKGIMGLIGKENKEIVLPTEEDDFLNAATMLSIYGLENSPDAAIFTTNQIYWLSIFIEYLSFDFWQTNIQKNIENTLIYFLRDNFTVKIANKKQSILLGSLIQNASNFNNLALAKELIKITKEQEHFVLLKLLSLSEREQYLINQKQLTNLFVLENCFTNSSEIWSADFSITILKECFAMMIEKNTYISERIGFILSQHLHPSGVAFLDRLNTYPATANQYYINYWEKQFRQPIINNFNIQSKINSI